MSRHRHGSRDHLTHVADYHRIVARIFRERGQISSAEHEEETAADVASWCVDAGAPTGRERSERAA